MAVHLSQRAIRGMIKHASPGLVSKEAIEEMTSQVQSFVSDVCKAARESSYRAGKKTISKEDILFVVKLIRK